MLTRQNGTFFYSELPQNRTPTGAFLIMPYISNMYRSWFTMAIVAFAMTMVGCTGLNVQQPPKAVASESAQVSKKKQKQQRPHIVAPPPAYGNRVVLAPAQHVQDPG